jgi:hypothetical protein
MHCERCHFAKCAACYNTGEVPDDPDKYSFERVIIAHSKFNFPPQTQVGLLYLRRMKVQRFVMLMKSAEQLATEDLKRRFRLVIDQEVGASSLGKR